MEIIYSGDRKKSAKDLAKLATLKTLSASRTGLLRVTNGRRFGAGMMVQQAGDPHDEPFILVKNSYGNQLWHFPGGGIGWRARRQELQSESRGEPRNVSVYRTRAFIELQQELKGYPVDNLSVCDEPTFSRFDDGVGRDTFGVFRATTLDIEYDLAQLKRASNELGVVALATWSDIDGLDLHHPVMKMQSTIPAQTH